MSIAGGRSPINVNGMHKDTMHLNKGELVLGWVGLVPYFTCYVFVSPKKNVFVDRFFSLRRSILNIRILRLGIFETLVRLELTGQDAPNGLNQRRPRRDLPMPKDPR